MWLPVNLGAVAELGQPLRQQVGVQLGPRHPAQEVGKVADLNAVLGSVLDPRTGEQANSSFTYCFVVIRI
jgi:hypothetical protein